MQNTTLDDKVDDFLAQKRIAVAGVSRDKGNHPVGNLIYHRLKTTGHEVFAVSPHMQTFEGDRCYPDLQSIPNGVDGVVIITRPAITLISRWRQYSTASRDTLVPFPRPWCIHTRRTPASPHSRTIRSEVSGRVTITTPSTPPGIDLTSG